MSSKSRRHETPNGLTKDPIKKDLTGGIYKASKRVCVFFVMVGGWKLFFLEGFLDRRGLFGLQKE